MFNINFQSNRPQTRLYSYKDRVDMDTSNRVFFIYYLGRYSNKPIFHYGETMDTSLVEFYLRKKVPIYQKKFYVPVEDHIYGKHQFDKYVKTNNLVTKIPVYGMEKLDYFTTNNKIKFQNVMCELYNIFQIIEV
jgi:hypothetical protein